MTMRSVVGAVEVAVEAALAGTPWERDPAAPPQEDDGAGAWPAQEVRLVWCGSYDAVRRRYPSLPQSDGGQPGGCVDLWVHLDAAGLLNAVDLEGLSLSDTFRQMQRPSDAEQADTLLGRPADDVAPRLARQLVSLLTDVRTDSESSGRSDRPGA